VQRFPWEIQIKKSENDGVLGLFKNQQIDALLKRL
jgi:hypothetical protein